MSHALSIRIDPETKNRLDLVSRIAAEESQLGEIEAGIKQLDAGETVSHEEMSTCLNS
jgi:predicted transcriptional regulator